MKRTTITLPDDLADLVEHEARRRHLSVSELVRRFIRQALGVTSQKRRKIPFAGIFSDPGMVAGERIDEELADHWADDLDRSR